MWVLLQGKDFGHPSVELLSPTMASPSSSDAVSQQMLETMSVDSIGAALSHPRPARLLDIFEVDDHVLNEGHQRFGFRSCFKYLYIIYIIYISTLILGG